MFQAQVIRGNDIEFDAILYPTQHQNTLMYIENSFKQLPTTLMDQGRKLFDMAYSKYQDLTSSLSRIRAMNAINSISNIYNENVIYSIKSIEDARQATMTMQRWIMAQVDIRKLYHDQQCDGYSSTYIDVEPNKIGEDHYDWRQVMSGIVRYDEEDLIATMYMDELRSGDRELTPFEQLTIYNSWEIIKIAVSQMNEDPTNPFGGKLPG